MEGVLRRAEGSTHRLLQPCQPHISWFFYTYNRRVQTDVEGSREETRTTHAMLMNNLEHPCTYNRSDHRIRMLAALVSCRRSVGHLQHAGADTMMLTLKRSGRFSTSCTCRTPFHGCRSTMTPLDAPRIFSGCQKKKTITGQVTHDKIQAKECSISQHVVIHDSFLSWKCLPEPAPYHNKWQRLLAVAVAAAAIVAAVGRVEREVREKENRNRAVQAKLGGFYERPIQHSQNNFQI